MPGGGGGMLAVNSSMMDCEPGGGKGVVVLLEVGQSRGVEQRAAVLTFCALVGVYSPYEDAF
jgi:hypothetical protein